MESTGKLTKKLVLQTADMLIERNNKPCKDFHLKIFQRQDDPMRVDFVYFPPEKYEKTVEKLQNTAQIGSSEDPKGLREQGRALFTKLFGNKKMPAEGLCAQELPGVNPKSKGLIPR